MKNLWPERFEVNTKPSAKELLEEQAKFLPKITDGLVLAEVEEVKPGQEFFGFGPLADFCFRFNILGKFLENYRFKVMVFSHDITLYPVTFRLDGQLAKELRISSAVSETKIDSPDELETFVGKVLTSSRIQSVVGSILRLSK